MSDKHNNSNYHLQFNSGKKKTSFIVCNNRNNPNSIDDIIASSFKLIENELTKDKSFKISKIEKLKPISAIKLDSKLRQAEALTNNLVNSLDNEKLYSDVYTVSKYFVQAEAIDNILKSIKKLLERQMNFLDYKQ